MRGRYFVNLRNNQVSRKALCTSSAMAPSYHNLVMIAAWKRGNWEEADHQGGMPEQAALAPAPRRMPCRPRNTSMSPSVLRHLPCMALLLTLAGCNSGNLKTASAYSSPPHAPPVPAPLYDPYAVPGQVPATWVPPVYDREGTIVRPRDPSVEWDFEDYQHAPWLAGRSRSAPPGTF